MARKKQTPRGIRNNNPLNIRRSTDVFIGEKKSDDPAFKQFTSMAYGYRAGLKILTNYYKIYSLRTIRQILGRFAPEQENNTSAYVRLVSVYTGIDPDTVLDYRDKDQMCAIVAAMSRVENGIEADPLQVKAGWDLLYNPSC